jgi:hypothetical protein
MIDNVAVVVAAAAVIADFYASLVLRICIAFHVNFCNPFRRSRVVAKSGMGEHSSLPA